MELQLEDIKEKSPEIWDRLPIGIRGLAEKNFLVFFYWYDDATSQITDIKSISIVPKITLGLYKDIPFTKSGSAYSLGYFQLPLDTQSGLFYQFISYYCKDVKSAVNEFYDEIKQTDLQNIERKKQNTLYHNVFNVFTRDIFRSSIDRFIMAEEVKNPIMTICDSIDSHLKQTQNKSLYGQTIAKVVMAIRNPNGGLIPETSGKLRYLYVGEKALEYSGDGTLQEAKEMLRNKFSVGEIYAKTSWFFNKFDNKWRKQISDADVKIVDLTGDELFMKDDSKFAGRYNEILGYVSGGEVTMSKLSDLIDQGWDTYLSDVLKHPTLYKNYPELFKLPIFFATNNLPLAHELSYNFYMSKDYMMIYGNPSEWDLKTVILHETQHAIQHIEGFATGGNDFIAKMIQAVGGASIKNFFYLRKQIADVYKLGSTPNGDYSYEKSLILYNKMKEVVTELDEIISWDEQGYYKASSGVCDMLVNLYQHPKLKKVIGEFLKPKITDSIDKIVDLTEKASIQSHKMMAQGLTERQVQKVFFETYEALAGEIEARDTQHTSQLEESMKGYLLPLSSETVDAEKVTVIIDDFISEESPIQSKIKAGVEKMDNGKYVIHLLETMSSEPLLHELGHIVADILGSIVADRISTAFNQDMIEEFGGPGEVFCEQFLSYILRQNISEDLNYDLENRPIEDKKLFDEELAAIFYIKADPEQDKEFMDRLNFIAKLNELVYASGPDLSPLAKYEEDVYSFLEEIGEMDRSDAQGVAEPLSEYIKASFIAGMSARTTAIKILAKTEVDTKLDNGGSVLSIKYPFDIQAIEQAFVKEDNRLASLPETEEHGNPFTICTVGARWLQKNYFPDSKVMGYSIEQNPSAEIGRDISGHDFLLVNGRYVIDFWYRHVMGEEDAPVVIDIELQPELLKRYYGDTSKWSDLEE